MIFAAKNAYNRIFKEYMSRITFKRHIRTSLIAIAVLFVLINVSLWLANELLNDKTTKILNNIKKHSLNTEQIKALDELGRDDLEYIQKALDKKPLFDDLTNQEIKFQSKETKNPYRILKGEAKFNELSLDAKCKKFYRDILPITNFEFQTLEDDAFFTDVLVDFQQFLNSRLQKFSKIESFFKEKLKNFEFGYSYENLKQSLINNRREKLAHNRKIMNEINNILINSAIFGKFFFNGVNEAKLCSNAEKLIYPWLSFSFPKYSIFKNGKLKSFKREKTEKSSPCFLENLQHNLNGKGIVVTVNDALVPELAGLIALLRTLNNELPIEIVYNNDLSKANKELLYKAATAENTCCEGEGEGEGENVQFKGQFREQELIFVDISKVIKSRYRNHFQTYSMKLLALLFSSFEEVIMLDSDTIPLIPIENFFQESNYLKSNTSFYKDREANDFVEEGYVNYFRSLLIDEADSSFFESEFPYSDKVITNNRFFQKFSKHQMESGLLLMNKKQYLSGILISIQLNFFKLIKVRLHGEKDLIWMGQLYAGNYNYKFNNNFAVAVGELTPLQAFDDSKMVARELCSTHPGHILDSDGKTLAWMNSGFLKCKKINSYQNDFQYNLEIAHNSTIKPTENDLKYEYRNAIKIKNYLKPVPGEYNVQNKADHFEPSRGWTMTRQCEGYLWCAYDVLGGGLDQSVPRGSVVEIDENLVDKYDYYGRLWVYYYNLRFLN
ncbi:hypothetical protein PACTADRAFT_34979 [Pachysolen tannophilus NRRL Y-2460]|uniref:Alpha-1,3-mannosyltransferase n=1 Tax=Pachysolen tannophilus NRRL Y-2460 TaxID=669874 RepID=A0A1E4TR17_PACTA|nr:hypothetical protein PACTADRAFT_34979 [Pachysolen tannophilus NRRL Y-2460]